MFSNSIWNCYQIFSFLGVQNLPKILSMFFDNAFVCLILSDGYYCILRMSQKEDCQVSLYSCTFLFLRWCYISESQIHATFQHLNIVSHSFSQLECCSPVLLYQIQRMGEGWFTGKGLIYSLSSDKRLKQSRV